jgi:hypothetical protein
VKQEDLKVLSDPAYVKYAEDRSIWRADTMSKLPEIRKAQATARANGDKAEVDRLEACYQEVLQLLAKY